MLSALFLLLVLSNFLGVIGGVSRLLEQNTARPADHRLAWLLILLTFAGIALRGIWLQPLSWVPLLLATFLTYRFIRLINARTRIRRMMGRAVPHT